MFFFQSSKRWAGFLLSQNVEKEHNHIDRENQIAKVFCKKTNKFISLEGVSFDIWLLLKKQTSYENLIKSLLESYDIDEKTLRKDVNGFLTKLEKQGLINYSEASK